MTEKTPDLSPEEAAIVARFGLDRPEHPDFDDPDFGDDTAVPLFLNMRPGKDDE